jgi:ABC-2 type transport system permease protein
LQDSLRDALSDALVEQRFLDAKVDPKLIAEMSRKANLTATKVSERGEEKTSQAAFFIVFGLGMLLMMSQLMYGMTILTAVMEEKETRLSEVLFSSVSAFPFLMGKLIGVVLVAITQFVIWGALVGVFALYGAAVIAAQGISVSMPQIPLLHFIYAALFFILGYFTYSTLYALVGAVVTSQEESQGVSLFVVIPLVFAFYMVFPIIRNPDSRLAFWASIAPFLSPITMPVRIVAQTPPVWEIALSLLINAATVVLVTWLSSRIYRIGMLMYGKRATLPEIWRWMRQA